MDAIEVGPEMKVVVVGYPLLGERQWNLCTVFERKGVETHVITPPEWPSIPEGDHPSESTPFEWHTHRTLFAGYMMRYVIPASVTEIRRLDPDVVLTHAEPWSVTAMYTQICCELAGIPHVVFTWENLERVPRSSLQRLFESITLGRIDGIIAGSAAAEDRVRTRGFTGSVTIAPETGVDTEMFAPTEPPEELYRCFGIQPDRPLVVYAGRLAEEKGLETLLDTFEPVRAVHPEVQYLLLGGGEMADKLETSVHHRGLDDVSLVTDKQPYHRMPQIHSMASVFAYPSQTTEGWAEQFGYSVAEAMSCGVPVVTTNCGSLPYVVGDAGIVCPEGDVESLASAIRDLLGDDARREQMGRQARERVVEQFGLETVAETHLDAFHDAM